MKKTLENIKRENEEVVKTAMCGSYCYYKLLMDKNIHKKDDIAEIMEYTLHRMINSNFTPEEILSNTLMFIPTNEQRRDIAHFTNISNGYIIVDMPEIV